MLCSGMGQWYVGQHKVKSFLNFVHETFSMASTQQRITSKGTRRLRNTRLRLDWNHTLTLNQQKSAIKQTNGQKSVREKVHGSRTPQEPATQVTSGGREGKREQQHSEDHVANGAVAWDSESVKSTGTNILISPTKLQTPDGRKNFRTYGGLESGPRKATKAGPANPAKDAKVPAILNALRTIKEVQPFWRDGGHFFEITVREFPLPWLRRTKN